MAKSQQVVEPVVRVQHDRHTVERLYVLASAGEWLARPDDKSKVVGPALVLVREAGLACKVYIYRSLRDARPWGWLGRLAKAGAWALNAKAAADLLPDELVAASPRFRDTTAGQRKAMAARVKPAAKNRGRKSD